MSIEGNPANAEREANGTTAERQFDVLLRLTNLVNRADAGVLSSFALTLDDADQRTQVIREDGKVYTYGYDAIGQLTNASATLPDGSPWSGYQFSYSYDATGNPIEQNKNGLVYSNSFNNLNQNAETHFAGALAALGAYSSPLAATVTVNNVQAQLHEGDWAAAGIPFVQGTNILTRTIQDLAGRSASATSTVVVADRAYAYDANGNMTTNGVFTYVWDCENRLTEVWKNGILVQVNRYDALWRRREKIEYAPDGTAVTNRYIYKDWLVLAITDGGGNILETYTHGADLSGHVGGEAGGIGGILAATVHGTDVFYHCDFNGNILQTTASATSLLSVLEYSPFGLKLIREGSFHPRFLFSSKEWDLVSSLYYFGTRHYRPLLTRWLSQDLIGELNGYNLVQYVGNKANNAFDSWGLIYGLGNPVMGAEGPVGPSVPYVPNPWTPRPSPPPWYTLLPDCPCHIPLDANGCPQALQCSDGNTSQWQSPSFGGHAGATWEMCSTSAGFWSSGQQCMYDAKGDLINVGSGAGTPDYVAPNGFFNKIGHGWYDYLPWFIRNFFFGSEYAEIYDHASHPPNLGANPDGTPCPQNDGASAPRPSQNPCPNKL